MSAPMSLPPSSAGAKGKGPLFWILITLGVLAVLGCIAVGVAIFAFQRAVKDIGGDFRNPALAAARIAASVNPDLEVVSENADEGTITVRQKSTGTETVMRLNSNGSLEIVSSDGKASVQFGQPATLPDWLPAYPGTSAQSLMSADDGKQSSRTFMFKTSDSPEKVFEFYEQRLKSAGFQIPTKSVQPEGGMMMANDEGEKRQAVFTIGASGEVVVAVSERN